MDPWLWWYHGIVFFFLLFLLFSTPNMQQVLALDNGLALVPPMGWNAWNAFGCTNHTNQEMMVKTAQLLLELHLDQVGYRYLNLDDCWSAKQRQPPEQPDKNSSTTTTTTTRTNQPRLVADPIRFPQGLKWLAQYLHDRGLKLGIYSSAGVQTCAGFPGSLGYEQIDAQTFADWGVDYVKYDNCGAGQWASLPRFVAMRNALNATGRPMVYSLCQWGHEASWQWAAAVGNSWRTTGDVRPTWRAIHDTVETSLKHVHRVQPGAWMDLDVLHLGNPHSKLTFDEVTSQFVLWALLKAPLLLSLDVTRLVDHPDWHHLVTHRPLLAWHQHADTRPMTRVHGRVNDDGRDDFSIYTSACQTFVRQTSTRRPTSTTTRTTPTSPQQQQQQQRHLLQSHQQQGQRHQELVVIVLCINWSDVDQPAQTMNALQLVGVVPFAPSQVVTIDNWSTHQPVLVDQTLQESGGTRQPLNGGDETRLSFNKEDWTYHDLQQVPIPALPRHASVVYQFTLYTLVKDLPFEKRHS